MHALHMCAGNVTEVVLSVRDLLPGTYSLSVAVRDVSGQIAEQVVGPVLLSGPIANIG